MPRRRRRGEGSAYYDHDAGSWVAVLSLGVVDGKRIRRKVRAGSKAEAERRREDLRRSYRGDAEPSTETLDRYLARWLIDHSPSVRPSTARSYAEHVRLHISPLLGGIRLADLRPTDVRRLVSDLGRKGKSPGTVHLVIRTLGAALNAAVRDRTIADNPTVGVRLPRIEREPVTPMRQSDAEAIADAVRGTWVEWPVRVWLGSGLRRGEVLGLDQADIGEGFVRVRVSKSLVRAVPITVDAHEALVQAVAAAPRLGPHEPVFFSPRTGDRMRGSSVTHALVRLVGLSPHKLRHGAATLMLADGVPMRVISEQLGHRNPALTARVYAHVIPEAQRSAIGSLERRRAR